MYLKDCEYLVGFYQDLLDKNDMEGEVEITTDFISFAREYGFVIKTPMLNDSLFKTLNKTRFGYEVSVQVYGDETGVLVKVF